VSTVILSRTMPHARDIGVRVDSNFNFNQHISQIIHKAHQRAKLIGLLTCVPSRNRALLLIAWSGLKTVSYLDCLNIGLYLVLTRLNDAGLTRLNVVLQTIT
jgi:hypothetical protein